MPRCAPGPCCGWWSRCAAWGPASKGAPAAGWPRWPCWPGAGPRGQVRSALLLAALRADGESSLGGALDSRDHTERLLSFLGLPCRRKAGRLLASPAAALPAFELEVPGGPSSAAL